MTAWSSVIGTAFLLLSAIDSQAVVTVLLDQLEDLTGGAIPIATLIERNNFANEFRYDVAVQNRTSHPILTDSLIVVVDQITDLAGKDATDRIEVVGPDGQTPTGKPYYKVPGTKNAQLAPYTESEPAVVRLRNPYYTILFEPSFRVLGQQVREAPPRAPAPTPPPPKAEEDPIKRLVEILIKKGILAPEDWTGEK